MIYVVGNLELKLFMILFIFKLDICQDSSQRDHFLRLYETLKALDDNYLKEM